MNFEDPRLLELNTPVELQELFYMLFNNRNNKQNLVLILDEIQTVPRWENFVRYIYATYKNDVQILVTDSNSKLLQSQYSHLLSGRQIPITVYPLSFKEYLNYYKIKYKEKYFHQNFNQIKSKLHQYILHGGLPELLGQNKATQKAYALSLLQKITTDDIIKLFDVKKSYEIEVVLQFIVKNTGCIISHRNTQKWLKNESYSLSLQSIAKFISYYKAAYLLEIVKKIRY